MEQNAQVWIPALSDHLGISDSPSMTSWAGIRWALCPRLGVCIHAFTPSVSISINTVFRCLVVPSRHHHLHQHCTFAFWAPDVSGTVNTRQDSVLSKVLTRGIRHLYNRRRWPKESTEDQCSQEAPQDFPRAVHISFVSFSSYTEAKVMLYGELLGLHPGHGVVLGIPSAFPISLWKAHKPPEW